MEEKLFWISLVSGIYAYAFKRFFQNQKRLADPRGVVLLNGLFWAFVGVAAGFLLASYKELDTLTWPIGVACAVAGGLLGVLWVLPTRLKLGGLQGLWALQGMVFASALGGVMGVGRGGLALGIGGLGFLGLAAGQLVRTASAPVAKAAVSGFLSALGGLAGFWLTGAGGADPSLLMILGLGACGYVLGNGWRPRLEWKAEENGVLLRESQEWADTGFSAILLAAVIMFFLVQAFKIPSGSMRSTLLEGDHLFVNKFIYGVRIPYTSRRILRWKKVQRGDVVVFRFPAVDRTSPHYGKDFIKRAIALPGDTVEIKDKRVFVNGVEQVEPYAQWEDNFLIPGPGEFKKDPAVFQEIWVARKASLSPAGENVRDNFGPIVVPPGNYFVMGDNRDRSYDARFWGPMPDANLKGRAWLLYLPFRRWKIIR